MLIVPTLAIVPMTTNNHVIGIVMLGGDEQKQFTDSEWRFIEMATSQLTTQIYNIQLYQETHESLHRRLQELNVIENIAQQISQSLDINLVIRNVLQAALDVTQAEVGVMALSSLDQHHLEFVCLEKINGIIQNSEFVEPIPSGLISEVIQTGETLVIPRNSDHENYIGTNYGNEYTSSNRGSPDTRRTSNRSYVNRKHGTGFLQ